VHYIVDTAALPDRTMALSGALSALAKGLDRKVLGPTCSTTVLFNLLLAATGSGKQHVLNCIQSLLRAMDLQECYAASGLSSMQAIEAILEGEGETIEPNVSPLVAIDEAGSWLARISHKSQTGNVSEIPGTLQTLWAWPYGVPWRGSKTKYKEMKDIWDPAFALWGCSTPRKFFEALKLKDVATGFVNRLIVFDAGRGAEHRVEPKYSWQQMPAWLVDGLRQCAGKPCLENRVRRREVDGRIERDYSSIGWTLDAKERWEEYEDSIRNMASEEDREYWIRAPEIAIRLATIEAAYLTPSLSVLDGRWIDLAGLEWAIAVAEASTRMLKAGLDQYGIEDLTKEDIVDRLREKFRVVREMNIGDCHQHCKRRAGGDYSKVDAALTHMVSVGDIEWIEQGYISPGKPTLRYRWLKK
jgi:hypothetical protein